MVINQKTTRLNSKINEKNDMNDNEMKAWIDDSDYETLLSRNRFAPSEDKIFHGEMGKYYLSEMAKKKREIGDLKAVLASKKIGWD